MDDPSFLLKLKLLIIAGRSRQWESVSAGLATLSFSGAAYLGLELKENRWSYAAAALGLIASVWFCREVLRKAWPKMDSSTREGKSAKAEELPDAIKALLPFRASDGPLFARLGMRWQLSRLLGLAEDDHVAITVLRGESGSGKTSLLRAGLEYRLGGDVCIYWEAVPINTEARLLYAIRNSNIPGFDSLPSLDFLPASCSRRCILVLDQFEQLRRSEKTHAAVFGILERIGAALPPHKMSIVVGYRREYLADWMDFEQSQGWRAEQIALDLIAEEYASSSLVTLLSEVRINDEGVAIDQALATKFIHSVAGVGGVSPVDVAIGVLGLANFAQKRGTSHVGLEEYKLSGGAEGLLLEFVRQKFEEIPDFIREPLLKGMALTLVDPLNQNQRTPDGATAGAIAARADGLPLEVVVSYLDRFTGPRIRLLEKIGPNYRLPQDKLASVLCQLSGLIVASDAQLRREFELGYQRWLVDQNNGYSLSRRNLLSGRKLRAVLSEKGRFVMLEDAAERTKYLSACLRRRRFLRVLAGVGGMAAYGGGRVVYKLRQQSKLEDWGLPSDVLNAQDDLDALEIGPQINDLGWLQSPRLRRLTITIFDQVSLAGLEKLRLLESLTLTLSNYCSIAVSGLDRLTSLRSLSLDLSRSVVEDLKGINRLNKLNSLSLKFGQSSITSLPKIENLGDLKSLSLDLTSSGINSLVGLESLVSLTSLVLNMGNIPFWSEIGKLTNLRSLTLSNAWMNSLPGLEKLNTLMALTLTPPETLEELGGIEPMTNLRSLAIDIGKHRKIRRLAGLEKLKSSLTSLTLSLDSDSQIEDLDVVLPQLTNLSSLDLNLRGCNQVISLAFLKPLKQLTCLSLTGFFIKGKNDWEILRDLPITSLSIDKTEIVSLDRLKALKGLNSLALKRCQVKSLEGLDQLINLSSLTLDLSMVTTKDLGVLKQLRHLTSLTLDLRRQVSDLDSLMGLSSSLKTLKLDLADSYSAPHTTSVDCLGHLGLKKAELWLPLDLVPNCARMSMSADERMVGCRLLDAVAASHSKNEG